MFSLDRISQIRGSTSLKAWNYYPGRKTAFLYVEHEEPLPMGDIKAALSTARLRWQQWHTERPHSLLSSHIFPLERCRPHLTPSVLVFFSSLSRRAARTFLPAPNLIFSLLFLWDCHFYTSFYQHFFSPLLSAVFSFFACQSLFCCSDILRRGIWYQALRIGCVTSV